MMMLDPFTHPSASSPPYPFHEGEVRMQKLRHQHDNVMSYAPQFVRPYMPDQHREFYENQPFLVTAALDSNGDMWSTMLFPSETDFAGSNGINNKRKRVSVATSPTPTTLRLDARVAPGDALQGQFRVGTPLGLLGIELGAKRRNRVNGHITEQFSTSSASSSSFDVTFEVDQSFGNCPQYITPRPWSWRAADPTTENKDPLAAASSTRGNELTVKQMQAIQNADTIFIATGYQGNDADDNDRRIGNDASHRGGPKGFLRVPNPNTILLPDYSGNNHYNSIGNLLLDDRMGMMIPNLDAGAYLQVSGTAQVVTNPDQVRELYPTTPGSNAVGAVIVLTVNVVNDVAQKGSIPIRWSNPDALTRVRVAEIVQESNDVKSFILEPANRSSKTSVAPTHKAGQYLPIHLSSPGGRDGPPLVRTYSLSRATHASGSYRISVKRHPYGQASTILHDHVQVGDWLSVEAPAGEFVLPPKDNDDDSNKKPIVLLSVGIGATPVLAMLDELVSSAAPHEKEDDDSSHRSGRRRRRQVLWVHGARNGAEHPFRNEVRALQEQSVGSSVAVTKHVTYSQPHDVQDRLGDDYYSAGRVDLPLVKSLLSKLRSNDESVDEKGPALGMADATYYLCGPPGFVSALETGLLQEGVAPSQLNSESF